MKTFLESVAADMLHKYKSDMGHIAVVFPNKRAKLFINEAIARLSDGPVWSPAYITISDLFRQHSDLTVAEPIEAIAILHESFTGLPAPTRTSTGSSPGDSCCWPTSTTSTRIWAMPTRYSATSQTSTSSTATNISMPNRETDKALLQQLHYRQDHAGETLPEPLGEDGRGLPRLPAPSP